MATTPPSLYVLAEELYRVGNANTPRLDHVRPTDIEAYESNGVLMVRANGRGISLGTEQYMMQINVSGWLWKIPSQMDMPEGLVVTPEPRLRKERALFPFDAF